MLGLSYKSPAAPTRVGRGKVLAGISMREAQGHGRCQPSDAPRLPMSLQGAWLSVNGTGRCLPRVERRKLAAPTSAICICTCAELLLELMWDYQYEGLTSVEDEPRICSCAQRRSITFTCPCSRAAWDYLSMMMMIGPKAQRMHTRRP